MQHIENRAVANVFGAYPPGIQRKLFELRELIFATAAGTEGVGELEETLKWGEPAYLTKNKGGSLVRIDWKKAKADQYAMYFHCQTNLVETFRTKFPNTFRFEGNRAIIFRLDDKVPARELSYCIAAALTYHRNKKHGQHVIPDA
jgi:Domain of unknown function (DU1801)